MSRAQERGLLEALDEAEALSRVIRLFSDGELDLRPVHQDDPRRGRPALPLHSWDAARHKAREIARRVPSQSQTGRTDR